MNGFNPEKYLADKSTDFNPDKYLSDKLGGEELDSSWLDVFDKYTGAPTRSAISTLQDDMTNISGAASAFSEQFGENPRLAPSGEDIVRKAGAPEALVPYLGFGMELIADPTNLIPSGMVAKGISKGAKSAGKGLSKVAESSAAKAIGSMKKDFKLPNINQIGRFAIDEKLVKAGDEAADVFDRAKGYLDDIGNKIGSLIDKASGGEKIRGGDVAAEVLSAVDESLGGNELARTAGAVDFFQDYADNIARKEYSAKDLHNLRREIDDAINWKPGKMASEYPYKNQGLISARNKINDIIGRMADSAEKGGAKGLRELNKKYHMASNVSRISGDKAAAESANRLFSLSDYIVGGGAGLAGGVTSGGIGGIATGLAAAQANKMARKYLPGVVTAGANKAGKALQNLPSEKSIETAVAALRAGAKGAQAKGQLNRKRLKALE